MRIQPAHQDFITPTLGSKAAGGWDIYMPSAGSCNGMTEMVGLGFMAAVPTGHVALLLPRSGAGAKHGVELNNTCGVIDADYRGEWKAAMRTKNGLPFSWAKGDRVLQFIVVPVANIQLEVVDSLDETERGAGGFGSSGS